ncbi:MAG TPA: nitrilase-related carbon-nitrogen hydrolase [Candidatus Polarisedimenticolia bacterium]|jgi:predicted amidohydrolase|nr:nitrilase-related carbon-nitrogen hydrolase [Candidatus Polarisedimenticolia bacterium]
MRIGIAQIAPQLGNLEANLALHLDAGRKAARAGADLILFPELSLTGYRLQDLVPDVARRIEEGGVLKPLFALSRRIALAFGMVEESEGHRYYNSAVFLEGGRVRHVHRKVYLPTYGLFEEGRYLAPGDTFAAFRSRAGRVGMLVCEDLWHPASALVLAQDGADLVLVLSNGPAHAGDGTGGPRHHEIWRDLVRVTAQMQTVYVVMTNRVGCEDGVSFFGGSMAVDPLGRVRAQARLHGEDLVFADLDRATLRRARTFYPLLRDERLSVLQREIARLAATPVAERGAGGS